MESEDTQQVVRQDKYDARLYRELREMSPALRDTEDKGRAEIKGFGNVMQDVFAGLFKSSPEKIDPCPEHLELQRQLMEQAEQTAEWQDLRAKCKLDEFSSAIGCASTSRSLIDAVPEEVKQRHNRLQQYTRTAQSWRDRLELYKDAAAMAGGEKRQHLEKCAANASAQADAFQKRADGAAEEMQRASAQHADALRRAVRSAAQQAAGEVQQARDMCAGFGIEPGSLQSMPVEMKMRLARELAGNAKLQQIAEKAGRFQRLAIAKQETRVKHGVDEIVDIELGDDLARVLPQEMILLQDEVTEPLFFQRYVERSLLQYRTEGVEVAGRGPLVVCIDNSGSMQGDRETWAKAFSLGLLTIARRQKRAFTIIHFGSMSELMVIPDLEKGGQEELLQAMSHFFGGGTDFRRPLTTAVELIGKQPKLKQADIVFVTDGECSLQDDFVAAFNQERKSAYRVYSVAIGATSTHTLDRISDEVVHLHDLLDDEKAVDKVYSI